MSKREAIARYTLIINKLRSRPATFAEISDYMEEQSELQGYDFKISKRTFQRDLADISSLYNINIEYDFSKKVYFISEDQPEINERILEAFDILNALNICDKVSNYIHFEKRKSTGTENMYGLLHAIKNHLLIKFTYQKYIDEEQTERKAEPYALKEFKNRWYVLAKDLKDEKIKTFALDRLTKMEITKKKFSPPNNLDVNEHYKYCFGIIKPNEEKLEEVILSFKPTQGKYIKSLPLHESQEILIDNKHELRIKLTLFITYDFFMELLSYGESVKVLAPKTLIKEIKHSLQKNLKQYE